MQSCRLLPPTTSSSKHSALHMDEENALFYVDIDILEKSHDQQKAVRQGRNNRIINNELGSQLFNIFPLND